MAARSGRVPTTLLAAVTATSRVRSDSSSPYCPAGSSVVARSTSAHQTVAPRGGLHPRPDVGVVVEPGYHDLVPPLPAPGQRLGEPVGEGGHVRAQDDPV